MAQDDVGIGHGRLDPALAVRRRAGLGTRRLRTDAERLRQLRHVGDGPTARADRVHVHRRHLDPEVADRRLAADRRLTVLAERHIGRGATHVEREDVVVACLAGDVERAGDAAGRAGEDAVDRVPHRLLRRHQAGVRPQDVDFGLRADPAELRLQVLDVARDLRPDVGVHAGGQGALVLPELGQDVAGQRHRKAGVEALDDRSDLLLVGGAHVRVDQTHGERLDARFDEVPDDPLDLRHVDGNDRLAVRVHSLDRLTRVRKRRGRIRLDHDDPARERAGCLGAGEVEDLAEALGRDQTDAGALRLEHGVRRDGGAVEDVPEVADPDPRVLADPSHAGEHALGRVVGRRRRLHPELGAAVALGYEEEVGEGTADVDTQPVRHPLSFLF